MATRVIGPVVVCFPDLFTPKVFEGKSTSRNAPPVPKYGIQLLIPKNNKTLLDLINSGIQEAIEEDSNGKKKLQGARNPTYPLNDGDAKIERPELHGHYFILAKSEHAPQVIYGHNRQPIKNPQEVYSGCICYVCVEFYAYSPGTKGITTELKAVLKYSDGPRLDAFSTVDVGTVFNGVPPSPEQPPVYGQPQPQAPVYGQPQPQAPVYGQPQPQAPVYGQPQPQPQPQAPVYGQPQ